MSRYSWSIIGADGQPILGEAHLPAEPPEKAKAVILIAHGFKGYKDYGMFPLIAQRFAERGFIAHRFNFSHSGMTNNTETFERPDLFELDTWNKQVEDIRAIIEAITAGQLAGTGLPLVLLGHSRGGVAVLLAAGRGNLETEPAGIITLAAPDRCNSLSDADAEKLLADGYLDSPSSRTGQSLRIGKAFLQEQLKQPEAHDVPALVRNITCPMLIIHGEDDPTVPPSAAQTLADAAGKRAKTLIIPGADHVFNTPNPFPADGQPSPQMEAILSAAMAFAQSLQDQS